jgi:TetR/AcrR family transcriptional regulator, transcriptional repressor of bet genes
MNTAPRFRRYSSEVRAAMLIEAGLACLAKGGIGAFTVDNISREAQASRGLIAHHFGSRDLLLAAVYEAAYKPMLDSIAPGPDGTPLDLPALIDRIFAAENTTPGTLNIWLALWGETTSNPALRAAHRQNYGLYRATVRNAITRRAAERELTLDADRLAISVIALVDGLWLEQCIDPDRITLAQARAACIGLLEPILGPLG